MADRGASCAYARNHHPWITAVLLLAACGKEEGGQQVAAQPPPDVTFARVTEKEVTSSDVFNGRVEAVDRLDLSYTDIRAPLIG